MEIKVGIVSDRGLNPRRPINQDSFLAVPQHGLFAVFDGVGGQKAGEVASRMAAETIEEALENISAESSYELINRAIKFANRDIYETAESEPEYRTMATTVALLHLDQQRATIAHVGDSRVYRFDDGYFYRETIDHTDSNDDLRQGLLPEGRGEKKGNVINRALGVEAEVEVELKTLTVREGSRFLLCSDGIYRHMPDEEIARVLAQSKDPQQAADELKRTVLARGADDNLTAIIVQLGRARVSSVIAIDDGLSAYREQQPLRAATTPRASAAPQPGNAPANLVKATTAASPKNRIEVDFAPPTAPSAWPEPHEAKNSFDEPTAKPRMWLWAVLFLVGFVGAFYLGLRVAEWRTRTNTDTATMSETAKQLKAAKDAFDKGDYAMTASTLGGVLGREPQNAEARYWLGRAQMEQGDYAKARENFDEAIKAQPKIADFYLYAAAAQKALGNKSKADEMLEHYVELRKVQQLTQPPTMQVAPTRNR
ncbi:MAG: protein phosphatase 2C domain-containing protein [Acidobacteria bacterium]|nr:protein phosphatase 2C domain-containing protein [Acidobacteriota bacterium]